MRRCLKYPWKESPYMYRKRIAALLLCLLFLFSVCPVPAAAEENAQPLKGVVIGLDPGHQHYHDNSGEPVSPRSGVMKQKVAGGCRGVRSGVYEYQVNLEIALLLRDLLTEAGAEVVLTRETSEVNISNKQRAELFNEREVDFGIRLHCNNSERDSARGALMLVPSKKCTDHFVTNLFIALTILEHYTRATGLPWAMGEGNLQFRDDQTGFNWCTRPIVCIEMGYLSNRQDDHLLSDPEFQQRMARGLYEGICACFDENGKLKITG